VARKLEDLTRLNLEYLTVLKKAERRNGRTFWSCECICGTIKDIAAPHLKSGATKSCGCLKQKMLKDGATIHGGDGTPEYASYTAMLHRCYNKTRVGYSNYGGRGISVCSRWVESFTNFFEDMGERPVGTSIDRIDNDLGYFKENCRWSFRDIQSHNRRKSVKALSEYFGVSYDKRYSKWSARITFQGKTQFLGSFHSEKEAALAYDKRCMILYGDVKNFKARTCDE